jgi:hypothetical protein
MTTENWYIYYPAPAAPQAALPLFKQMQRRLEASAGVRARLEARVEAERPTWMEVYEDVVDAGDFGAALEQAVAALGLAELAGARHIERFRTL